MTRKWIEINDLSNGQYSTHMRFKIPMLKSDLCNYSDVYVFVKGTIHLTSANENDNTQKTVAFTDNARLT